MTDRGPRRQRVPRLPRRAREGHKGTFGTVGVLAGSDGMLGAAILCARGALRGGAGLVRVYLPRSLQAPFTVAVPAATTEVRRAAVGADCGALVIGPGLGATPSTRTLVRACLARLACALVLDADALNVLAPLGAKRTGPSLLKARAVCVLTPHPGEAARLLASTVAVVQRDRGRAARTLATRSGQIVVLKGARTLVTDGDRLFTNSTGNPGMGTGGSGDVLAGLLGALLAQGLPAFDAACLAVHAHGAAGDLVARRLSEPGLCAEDLPLAIAEVLKRYER